MLQIIVSFLIISYSATPVSYYKYLSHNSLQNHQTHKLIKFTIFQTSFHPKFSEVLEKMVEKFDSNAVIEEFEVLTKEAERIQKEMLKKILEENCETEYLQKWGLNGRTDSDTFKAVVPIVTHKDLEPYIQRIADGEDSPILTAKPITTLSLSSGTSQGKPKLVPFNDDWIDSAMQVFKTSFAFRNREYPTGGGMQLQFIYVSKQSKTKGGLAVGTATINGYRNAQIKKMVQARPTPSCSPDEVKFGPEFHQSLYCHLLCGLIFRDKIQFVSSVFAYSIVLAFRTFEQLWEELVDDIRKGTLSSRITVPSIRSAMSKIVKPDPELANLIHNKCLGLGLCNWYGLIEEIFPNTKYVYGVMTGSMEPYLVRLRHYAGGLPLLSADYGSSEGWVGLNMNPRLSPELTTFAIIPNAAYFEFIPLKGDANAEPRTLELTEVRVDEEYEVVFTTSSGLYRYRLCDVVKIKGFHNSTPMVQFVRRSNLVLSINIDKCTEKDLQLSVEAAAKHLAEGKQEVVDYTSRVDSSADPAHYVIYWEITGEPSDEILKACCNCLDASFQDIGYISSRKVESIGPLQLRIIKKGTFHKIMAHCVALGAAVNQFKTPRCVGLNNTAVLQILDANVVKSYYSSAYSG